MTEPLHFDLDALEVSIRSSFAESEAEAKAHSDCDIGLVECQVRAVDVMVALHRWLAGEYNRGTDAETVFESLGTTLGRALADGLIHASKSESPAENAGILIGSIADASNVSPEFFVGLDPVEFFGTVGGRA